MEKTIPVKASKGTPLGRIGLKSVVQRMQEPMNSTKANSILSKVAEFDHFSNQTTHCICSLHWVLVFGQSKKGLSRLTSAW